MNLDDARVRMRKVADSVTEAIKLLGKLVNELVMIDGAIANIQGTNKQSVATQPRNGRRTKTRKARVVGAKPEVQVDGGEVVKQEVKPSLPDGHFPPTPVKRGRPAKAKLEPEETGNEETAEA